ncbi:hypothetical protein C8J56DRAFT_1021616 [Mycena floridula]|nr:hypothetical protein C8J56DRAFT_1021616 [Mycena floridula]
MAHNSFTLPNELWIEVFSWATASKNLACPYSCHYTPFQGIQFTDRGSDTALPVKKALVRVCRLWRALTAEFLFRDLRVNAGQEALKTALHSHDLARHVRRVVLPYQATSTPSPKPLTSIQILHLCNQVEVLVRPPLIPSPLETVKFEFDAESVALPLLKRLEWWQNSEAERSGGVNSLATVLRGASNLEYLLIGGFTGITSAAYEPQPLCLPTLRTLRLHAISALLLRQISTRWTFPELRTVIIDYPLMQVNEDMLNLFWEAHGESLQHVEFGKHLRFLTNDFLTPCMEHCPNLAELNYHVFFTVPPSVDLVHPSITSIGMDFASNDIFGGQGSMWALLHQHFNTFIEGKIYPQLKVIKFHGGWEEVVDHPNFALIRESLKSLGCTIQFA